MIKTATILLAAAAGASASIAPCSTAGRFTINSLSMLPDPPVVGQNVTMTFDYTNPGAPVAAGTAKYSISYNGIPYSSTEDLCTQVPCPITAGEHVLRSSSLWDGSASGKIVTTITWADEAGAGLLCVQVMTRT